MRGTMITIGVDGSIMFVPVDKSPELEALKRGLNGGYLEIVPGWVQFPFENGTFQPCVAFCDEHGKLKGLPVNDYATDMWHAMLRLEKAGGLFDPFYLRRDNLVGPIVILTGDEAFMRSLRDDGEDDEL